MTPFEILDTSIPVDAISQPTALRSSDNRKPWLATPMIVAMVPSSTACQRIQSTWILHKLTYFRHLEVTIGIRPLYEEVWVSKTTVQRIGGMRLFEQG